MYCHQVVLATGHNLDNALVALYRIATCHWSAYPTCPTYLGYRWRAVIATTTQYSGYHSIIVSDLLPLATTRASHPAECQHALTCLIVTHSDTLFAVAHQIASPCAMPFISCPVWP